MQNLGIVTSFPWLYVALFYVVVEYTVQRRKLGAVVLGSVSEEGLEHGAYLLVLQSNSSHRPAVGMLLFHLFIS